MEAWKPILDFWFGDLSSSHLPSIPWQSRWWTPDPAFDKSIEEAFLHHMQKAMLGEYELWLSEPKGRLALILLIDQFCRNIYRGTPQAFVHDKLALQWCIEGLDKGMDKKLLPIERVFMYLPLEHAESLPLQERSVQLFHELYKHASDDEQKLFQTFWEYAKQHHCIIKRFGRFVHRNKILGRPSSLEEIDFLSKPGSSF